MVQGTSNLLYCRVLLNEFGISTLEMQQLSIDLCYT